MKFKLIPIETIEITKCDEPVYDLTVSGDHSYTINNVAVHNSVCTTRNMTGIGVPMITSIIDCVNELTPIIADGGIRMPGDVCKAIGAGASCVMLGNMLAGTDEAPGQLIHDINSGSKYKIYRGSASIDSKLDRGESRFVEGDATTIKYKGPVSKIIQQVCDGLKSSMSYVGASTIEQFQSNVEFTEVTQNGVIEASAHAKRIVF